MRDFLGDARRWLPVAISLAIVVFAADVLYGTWQRIELADVVARMREIAPASVAFAATFVLVVYAGIAAYETLIARFVNGPVSARRAVLGALTATPIGHAVGLGALSGGAVRYRLYAAVDMRPLDIGKMVLLAAMPYAAGLGLLLGLSLVLRTDEAASILRVAPEVARSSGLTLLALHAIYVAFVFRRRTPVPIGRLLIALPPPNLTGVQYAIGAIEVCAAAALLYVLLPDGLELPFLAFVGVYVLAILAGLASSVPAGLGVFESVLLVLLPQVPPDRLLGAVLVYRLLLEFAPLLVAVALFGAYEGWSRLPEQRRAAEARRRAARALREAQEREGESERERRRGGRR